MRWLTDRTSSPNLARIGRFVITAWTESSPPEPGPCVGTSKVKLEIEVCHIQKMSMYGVHFKRIKGDMWQYNRLCNALVERMHL